MSRGAAVRAAAPKPFFPSPRRRPQQAAFFFKHFLRRRGAELGAMIEMLALALFAGLLCYAACTDIASLTIPNWVSIALAGAFPIAALATGMGTMDIGAHLLFGVGALVVGFLLFQANILGGGDAKLIAAACVWTGASAFVPFLLWTTVSGGILALVLVTARQFLPQTNAYPAFVNHLLQKQNGIPYGVAILGGGLMAIPSLPFDFGALTIP
jgi:prepilin peptidase CpaA